VALADHKPPPITTLRKIALGITLRAFD